ncbi:MAG: ABC transporter ATP-binding protein [Burkholderiales bacterium PBB4]|nr:MAG: ABC transporter ATP-binding protein [Burkholderiales bacterium PBB4]
MPLYALIASFVRRHWRAYIVAGLMLASVAALTVVVPRLVGSVVDGLARGDLAGPALFQKLGLLLACGVGIYFLRVGWRLQLFAASFKLGVELRTKLYARLCLQGPSFFQQQRTGDLMALATNDVDAVEMASGEAMLAGFDGTLTLVMVVAMMTLGVDWRLAAVALLPFPLMAVAFWHISEQIHQASRDALQRFSALNDHVQETLSGVRTLRALGLEARSASSFAELTAHAAEANLRAQRWEAAYEPAVGISLVLASGLTLSVGGYFVWQDQLSVGALVAFNLYLGQLIWPMFAAGWVLSLLERGRAAWDRLHPVLELPLSIEDHGMVGELTPGTLALGQVSLRYANQTQDALTEVSVAVPPGHTLGIVGPTGAGKSSLLRLILRQYVQSQGTVQWNGIALADYTLETLHGAISWVPQEPFLFSASIAENIALGKPEATRAEVEAAAALASIHDEIARLPQGYETPVGEKGITLSGGQRQRVAIARALLANAPLLLLDDALSAVDTHTEAQILSHLRDARQGRTVIVVSHRLSAVQDADHIVVLQQGRVVEAGDHAALLARGAWYASQWQYQQLEASLAAP